MRVFNIILFGFAALTILAVLFSVLETQPVEAAPSELDASELARFHASFNVDSWQVGASAE